MIERTKRPFMITPEGKKFFEACLVLLDTFEKAKAEITSQRKLDSGAVRVAVIYSVGLHDMGIFLTFGNGNDKNNKEGQADAS